jgi:hypothetical protein
MDHSFDQTGAASCVGQIFRESLRIRLNKTGAQEGGQAGHNLGVRHLVFSQSCERPPARSAREPAHDQSGFGALRIQTSSPSIRTRSTIRESPGPTPSSFHNEAGNVACRFAVIRITLVVIYHSSG